MNFQQLRAIREAVRRGFNLTDVAAALNSSQPVVSRQVRELEDELGVNLFVRTGKRLVGLTEVGKAMLPLIERILSDADGVRQLAAEQSAQCTGELSIASTHAHARYMLPQVLKDFRERYPQVGINLRQGALSQVVDMVLHGEADICIATDSLVSYKQLVSLPCYRHSNMIVVQPDHPLLKLEGLVSLHELAKYPIVTYERGLKGRVQLEAAFERAGLKPNIALGAVTADVIKTYVELGIGVGVATSIAWDEERDSEKLRMLDAAHLFPISTTSVAWARGHRLPGVALAFIETFAPTLTTEAIKQAEAAG